MSKLSREEERQLISDAEAARDDPAVVPEPVEATPAQNATIVLSVRLPAERARQFREAAAARQLSLSELLDRAVETVSLADPRVAASESTKRLVLYNGVVSGAVADTEEPSEPREEIPTAQPIWAGA